MKMDRFSLRPARPGDGAALFDVTRRSVEALARHHYTPGQIAGWMGDRTSAYYEDLIAKGDVVVAEFKDTVMGFVDSEPGEVTRLFLLPGVAGSGLGARLLAIGIENARKGHRGPIKVESTINAEGFYRRHGFRTIRRGYFSHGLGGDPLEIVHVELSP